MRHYKIPAPITTALMGALAMVLPAACGGSGTGTPSQAPLPSTSSGIGNAAALRNVSGEYDGTISDSVFGSGRSFLELSQYQNAASGILTMTFGSTAFITPISYVLSGSRLTGTDNYTLSATSSSPCAFTETATYQNRHLNGSYQAVSGCMNDHGTFKAKQVCRFARGSGTDFGLKTCKSDDVAPMLALAQRGGSSMGKAQCQPDFTLALSPTRATITTGQSVKVTVLLTSLCGLAGTINVGIHGISPPPQGGDGFTIHEPRYDIPLDANSTAVAYITLGASPNTLKTTWTITIAGKDITGGCCYGLTHSANFALTVQ